MAVDGQMVAELHSYSRRDMYWDWYDVRPLVDSAALSQAITTAVFEPSGAQFYEPEEPTTPVGPVLIAGDALHSFTAEGRVSVRGLSTIKEMGSIEGAVAHSVYRFATWYRRVKATP